MTHAIVLLHSLTAIAPVHASDTMTVLSNAVRGQINQQIRRGVPMIFVGTETLNGWSAAQFEAMRKRLVARIARVKLLAESKPEAKVLGQLGKHEEVIYLGETDGRYLKVRSAELEGWADQALLGKP